MKVMLTLALLIAATSSAAPVDVTKQFAALAPRLKAKTHVPVLLPRTLPSYFRGEKLYLIVDKADAKNYVVDLALSPDCKGEHACSAGHVAASSSRITGGSLVSIAPGLVGRYIRSISAAYPTDAELIWRRQNEYYDVGMPGSLADLLLVARSMKRY